MKRCIELELDCWAADPGPLCISRSTERLAETVENTDGAKVSDTVKVTGALVMVAVELPKLCRPAFVTVKGMTIVCDGGIAISTPAILVV